MKIETTKREYVIENIDKFISIGGDADIRAWRAENYLMDAPGKWLYSFCAILNDNLIGYVFASQRTQDTVHIHHIALARSFRGAGYGLVLLNEMQDRASQAEAKLVTLKVNSHLPRLCEYYKKHNFRYLRQEGDYEFLARPVLSK